MANEIILTVISLQYILINQQIKEVFSSCPTKITFFILSVCAFW